MGRVSGAQTWSAASQRQGHDDQVAGGALDQACARTGPICSDDEVPLPVARVHPVGTVGALQSIHRIGDNGWCAPACREFLAHPPARGQTHAVLDQRLVGVGVDPRVDRLVADRCP